MKKKIEKQLLAIIVLLAVAAPFCIHSAKAAQENRPVETFLFPGGTVDSTENASPWIPIRGANRVILRSWSGKAAWAAATDADSAFTDTITTFRVAFTDSVSDVFPTVGTASVTTTANSNNITSSAAFGSITAGMRIEGTGIPTGTIVREVRTTSSLFTNKDCTAAGSITATFSQATAIPIGQDSVIFSCPFVDTTTVGVLFSGTVINKVLRGPSNGSGIYCYAVPTPPASVSTYGDGSMTKGWMRVYITPRRRSTSTSWDATVPNRVNGLKNFRMKAYVWYVNQ